MGGVSGRTDVANAYTNHLTKLQCVRYYISFRMMKAAEAYFDSVMCLSGPLSCYRLDMVREVYEKWLHQTFLGQKATFGDDRSLTNFIVEHHRTYYQDTAICSTIVPNRHKVFLRQQMRWKRSWLRESLKAGKFIWKKEPMMSIFFYLGLLIPLIAPFCQRQAERRPPNFVERRPPNFVRIRQFFTPDLWNFSLAGRRSASL